MGCSQRQFQTFKIVQEVRDELILEDTVLTIRSMLRYVPFAMELYRLWTAWQLDASFIGFRKTKAGLQAREATGKAVTDYMKSVAAPQYFDILIPKYGFGMKRPVMDHGYLESTNKPNFELIKCDGLQAVDQDKRTLVDALGGRHYTDIVILANGFQTQDLLAPMTIRGESDKDLKTVWRGQGGAEAYMGYVEVVHRTDIATDLLQCVRRRILKPVFPWRTQYVTFRQLDSAWY